MLMVAVVGSILASLLLFSAVVVFSWWETEHWPVEPLTSVTCEKVQGLSIHPDAISAMYYNSVLGVLLLTYQFADGTTIETHWSVTDLMHERAADYTIKLAGHLTMYRIVYRDRTELWIDAKGEGNCRDFKRQE